jgi:hypothetical protein
VDSRSRAAFGTTAGVGLDDRLCNSLKAFVNEVNAQTGKKLTEEEAQLLLAAAEGLRATQEYREPEGVPARERE